MSADASTEGASVQRAVEIRVRELFDALTLKGHAPNEAAALALQQASAEATAASTAAPPPPAAAAPLDAVAAVREALAATALPLDPPLLATLIKIANNIISHPDDPSYRRLRRGNSALQARIFSRPRGEVLLRALGFHDAPEDSLQLDWPADGREDVRNALVCARDVLVSAAASPPPPPPPRLARICGGVGWVVHLLVLEFVDGSRSGAALEATPSPTPPP